MEGELKKNLSELSKIPKEEFERQFCEWLERDDVARSLQANLRADLINKFNKTSLGKQILSQAHSMHGMCGALERRLTLSSLVLALNILVAEFLYAQNCHFTLSVFCTEIPFRNILPDFGDYSRFRFTEAEIIEILDAICGSDKFSCELQGKISNEYIRTVENSLLLTILKNLLRLSHTNAIPIAEPIQKKMVDQATMAIYDMHEKNSPKDDESQLMNANYENLNKYILALLDKVIDMTVQINKLLESPQLCGQKVMSLYSSKAITSNLEHMAKHLKRMPIAKWRKSKQVSVLIMAIQSMAAQFQKCSANFDDILKYIANRPSTEFTIERGTMTEISSKTYKQWVHEMRTTNNGKKFLNRVEVSLGKTLEKQRQNMLKEMNIKLKQQRQLLKIHYKKKLMEQLSNHALQDNRCGNPEINENVQHKMKEFEMMQTEILRKVEEAQKHFLNIETVPRGQSVEKSKELQEELQSRTEEREVQTIITIEEELRQLMENISRQGPTREQNLEPLEEDINVDEGGKKDANRIVYDAKLRLQQLEHESTQLDKDFKEYLERQKLQKEANRQGADVVWQYLAVKKNNIDKKYEEIVKKRKMKNKCSKANSPITLPNDAAEDLCDHVVEKATEAAFDSTKKEKYIDSKAGTRCKSLEERNAILEAKEKLFSGKTINEEIVGNALRLRMETTKRSTVPRAGKTGVLCSDLLSDIEFDNYMTKNENYLSPKIRSPINRTEGSKPRDRLILSEKQMRQDNFLTNSGTENANGVGHEVTAKNSHEVDLGPSPQNKRAEQSSPNRENNLKNDSEALLVLQNSITKMNQLFRDAKGKVCNASDIDDEAKANREDDENTMKLKVAKKRMQFEEQPQSRLESQHQVDSIAFTREDADSGTDISRESTGSDELGAAACSMGKVASIGSALFAKNDLSEDNVAANKYDEAILSARSSEESIKESVLAQDWEHQVEYVESCFKSQELDAQNIEKQRMSAILEHSLASSSSSGSVEHEKSDVQKMTSGPGRDGNKFRGDIITSARTSHAGTDSSSSSLSTDLQVSASAYRRGDASSSGSDFWK